ncbi:MAG: hypothetical protein N2C14_04145 [Planctomycetales bacterium]
MPRSSAEIADSIAMFQPQDGEWLKLDELLEELFQSESPPAAMDALLHVFQRFPTEDGAGVFWGIVHGLESLPDYEERLIQSVRAEPSEFGIIMLHRLLNSGVEDVGGVGLRFVIESTVKNESVADEVRARARKFMDSWKG